MTNKIDLIGVSAQFSGILVTKLSLHNYVTYVICYVHQKIEIVLRL